jgi:uncharacterized protein YcfJ
MRKIYAVLVALGVVLVGARAALALVCPVALPEHSSTIGAAVELPERIAARRCQGGDILAISGDVHMNLLARVCDLSRSVVLHPIQQETGRPSGAICTYVGLVRAERPMPDEAPRSVRAPDASDAPRVPATQATQPPSPAPQAARAMPIPVPFTPPPFVRAE